MKTDTGLWVRISEWIWLKTQLIAMRDERGSVALEFIGIVIALYLPIAYFAGAVNSVAQMQSISQTAARSAARAYVNSVNDNTGWILARRAARSTYRQAHMSTTTMSITVTCSAVPCLTPGEFVTVEIIDQAPIAVLNVIGFTPASVRTHSASTMVVDELRMP